MNIFTKSITLLTLFFWSSFILATPKLLKLNLADPQGIVIGNNIALRGLSLLQIRS